MRSIERKVHIEGRSAPHTATDDVVRGQQPQDPKSSSPSPLPTIRIQQATISTSQQFTVPADTISTSNPTMPAKITKPAAPSQERHSLPAKSIAGLAMIPVAVLLIAVAIFTYLWLRKRRRRAPIICHLGSTPPPAVPEKDFCSPTSSFDSTASGGKVRSMNAMSTPVVHTGWIASPRSQARPSNNSTVHHNPWNDQLPKVSADITSAGLQVPRGADVGDDSPIDRSSPFRLKTGDTKRSSLDPDVMSAWPAPPQPAVQPAPLQSSRTGKTYMERRSISAEYFAQERDSRDARGAQEYWEDVRLELGPDPGPTVRSH
ncbi:hypothetical protein BU25DRAFT_166146 [Macroventuria anomochaeta]|uniref:Uncharacterized protein n=1 Tax=Macroventuria anomochaeta TaxID=301207 RepID=A0ACB6RSC6_9PLEO|nr:uncharacterized protein BU25DRAFT_166146 [Macroventuria anomochaeta]KAF2624038.1 hypothetical protein BU25DRAFT_166146 [Macroventuria anomochaeta]